MMSWSPASDPAAAGSDRETLSPALAKASFSTLATLLFASAVAATIAEAIVIGEAAMDGGSLLFLLPVALILLFIVTALVYGNRLVRAERARLAARGSDVAALEQAKEASESANEAKSRYLANVSHELRSPLNAIYGYAQLVERDGVEPREAARVILRCAEHLTYLVEGLLDISQLESGVLRVRSEEVRLAQFMDQIVSMMKPAASSKGLEFVYVPPERMPELVRLDQSRFRQVLLNLLSNAIKFTDKGSVTLKLGYSGQIATFEVCDTGPGIPAEDHVRIFERYERGGQGEARNSGPSGRKPGAGLGLAIARTIVEILGGKLELESTVGIGTCFRITIMLGEVLGRMPTDAPTLRRVGYNGRPRAVLLLEDDPDQRLSLERLLRSLGFVVSSAESGEAALAIQMAGPPDIAILDISMPGISGWETARRLRARHGDDLRILMFSANSEERHRPEDDDPAHDMFLVKPVEFETLVGTVGELLGLSWRWESGGPSAGQQANASAEGIQLDDKGRAHIARIQEFLRIGFVRGIETEIRALEAHCPAAQPLVRKLFDYLDRYDLAGMARLLKGDEK